MIWVVAMLNAPKFDIADMELHSTYYATPTI
jgi:hypothetical protein